MKQEDFEIRREEFLTLVNGATSIPRPLHDYRTLSNATFATFEFLRRLMEIQAFFMAHYRATGKLPANKKDIEHLLVMSLNLTPTGLAAIYCKCADSDLVALLLHLKIEELFIGAELETRLADKRIGTVMILVPFFEGSKPTEKWLIKKLVGDKAKAHGYDKAIQVHDVRYDSVLRGLELAAQLEAPSYEPGPLPAFPLEMSPPEASFWNIGLAKAWRKGHETLRRGLIPVLNGDAETIPTSTANYRDTERKKARDRWGILYGLEALSDEDGKGDLPTKEEGCEEEIFEEEICEKEISGSGESAQSSELTLKQIHPDTEAILSEINSKITTPEDSVAERELGAKAYDYVLSRWGETGVKFLRELIDSGGNVKAASEAAGISRVTGHKRRTALEIFLPRKKPAK